MKRIDSVPIMMIHLLSRFRSLGPLRANDTARLMLIFMPRLIGRWGVGSEGKLEGYLSRRLEELESMGLVKGSPDEGYLMTWDGGDPGLAPPIVGDDGVRLPPPPDNEGFGGGAGNDGQGIGVREVLTHPTLFSLTDEDFDGLLRNMLGDEHDN